MGKDASELEKKLGLVELSPFGRVLGSPTIEHLRCIPKTSQTYDLLLQVCSNDGMALGLAAQRMITPKLCEIAVRQNGLALAFFPQKIIDGKGMKWYAEMCERAVSNNGTAIQYVPAELISKDLAIKAIMSYDSEDPDLEFPIAFIPNDLLSKELLEKSIEKSPLSIKDIPVRRISKILSRKAVLGDWHALEFIPSRFIDEELVEMALRQDPMAIQFIPREMLNASLCQECFCRNPSTLGYIPSEYVSREMCQKTIQDKLFSVTEASEKTLFEEYKTLDERPVRFGDFPEKLRNDKSILDEIVGIYIDGATPIINWNEMVVERKKRGFSPWKNFRNEEIKPLQKKTIDYLKTRAIDLAKIPQRKMVLKVGMDALLETSKSEVQLSEELSECHGLVVTKSNNLIEHDVTSEDMTSCRFHYVSDIHIEHQLKNDWLKIGSRPQSERSHFLGELIGQRVGEMVASVNQRDEFLLIGGDVACSVDLSAEFYHELYCQWNGGTIISILGNHELWDGTTPKDWENPNFVSRPVEEIVRDYRIAIGRGIAENPGRNLYVSDELRWNERCSSSVLLENDLFVVYKDRIRKVIHEEDILEAPFDELTDLLSKCTVIVLGGIGYSGFNPLHNAETALYRKAIVSFAEDRRRSERFQAVYDKISRAAGDGKVIVLSHTPMRDWSEENYNPSWIYICGHTHQNAFIKGEDGTTVFADNQIGYEPKKWTLQSFLIDRLWYDPFENYKDGIYPITSDEYAEFNKGRGIMCNGCSYPGKLLMLKRGKSYMFLLQTTQSLCILIGGQRKKLNRKNVAYYFANMAQYVEKVRELIKPYQMVMQRLSEEVKRIGGTGRIHGCIVDIGFFTHIYVNPYDGRMTPYFAWDITARKPFASVEKLLEKEEPQLLSSFHAQMQKHAIPLIGSKTDSDAMKIEEAVLPKWIYGTAMYEPSRIMKSIQYVWEQNVIRIWNDDVLYETSLNARTPRIE